VGEPEQENRRTGEREKRSDQTVVGENGRTEEVNRRAGEWEKRIGGETVNRRAGEREKKRVRNRGTMDERNGEEEFAEQENR
jgi:hypothetical protein